MASEDKDSTPTSPTPSGLGTDMGLEVVTLPVSDVDRAKSFYQSLGWRLDVDIAQGQDFRVVQFTPPHSQSSIHFGIGLTASPPGSVDRMILAVENIDVARDDLIRRGVAVSEAEDTRPPGSDPAERSYSVYASFKDPDGNGWLLQEITTRLPGREWADRGMDVGALGDLLHETAEHHAAFEAIAPPHDWWDWYAAYASARKSGSTSEDASAAAGHLAEVKHVVVSDPA